MKLNLNLFGGGGSSSGSPGAANERNVSGNQYKAEKNFWKATEQDEGTGSGMRSTLNDLESKAGGELGKEIVKVQISARNPLSKILLGLLKNGGKDNFYITREGGFLYLHTNRAGWVNFSEQMKFRYKKLGKWW